MRLDSCTGGLAKKKANRTSYHTLYNEKTGFFWQGELVYVNYGRVEDYRTLENLTSINVTGKIVLARYGKIFRGDKVKHSVFLI